MFQARSSVKSCESLASVLHLISTDARITIPDTGPSIKQILIWCQSEFDIFLIFLNNFTHIHKPIFPHFKKFSKHLPDFKHSQCENQTVWFSCLVLAYQEIILPTKMTDFFRLTRLKRRCRKLPSKMLDPALFP